MVNHPSRLALGCGCDDIYATASVPEAIVHCSIDSTGAGRYVDSIPAGPEPTGLALVAAAGTACTQCSAAGDCVAPEACQSATGAVCQPDGVCAYPSTCQSPDACHQPGLCSGAECQPPTLSPGYCFIGSQCVSANAPDPSNPCSVCSPAVSTTGWSPLDGAACDDGNDCTANDVCKAGVCAGSAPAAPLITLDSTVPSRIHAASAWVSGVVSTPSPLHIVRVTVGGAEASLQPADGGSRFSIQVDLHLGDNVYVVGATDSCGQTTSLTVSIDDVNAPPVWNQASSQTWKEGSHYTLTLRATDADGDPLSYTWNNQPSWVEYDAATGVLSAAPPLGSWGNYTSKFTVSDGIAAPVSLLLPITVQPRSEDILGGGIASCATGGSTWFALLGLLIAMSKRRRN